MVFKSFLGFLTLRVGVGVLGVVFFVIAFYTSGANFFTFKKHPDNYFPFEFVVVLVFVLMIIATGILLFTTAYLASRTGCFPTLFLITIVFIYWAVLTIFSFTNNPTDVRKVCVKYRCPESFWLAHLTYRSFSPVVIELPTTVAPNTTEYPEQTDDQYPPVDDTEDPKDPEEPEDSSTTEKTEGNIDPDDEDDDDSEENNEDGEADAEEDEEGKEDEKEEDFKKFIVKFSLNRKPNESSVTHEEHSTTHKVENVIHFSVDKSKRLRVKHGDKLFQELTDPEYSETFEDSYKETDDSKNQDVSTKKPEEDRGGESVKSSYIFGAAFFGAIVFACVNLTFFLFAICIVWSFAQELKRLYLASQNLLNN